MRMDKGDEALLESAMEWAAKGVTYAQEKAAPDRGGRTVIISSISASKAGVPDGDVRVTTNCTRAELEALFKDALDAQPANEPAQA